MNYNPEQRRRAVAAVGRAVTRPDVLAGLGIGAVVVGAVRRLRRRSRAALRPPDGPARWFDQLLAVLAAHGFVPEPGQTPREFADAVAAALRERPAAAAVADVPVGWAEAYYAARFGDAALAPDRKAELERRLTELGRALRT